VPVGQIEPLTLAYAVLTIGVATATAYVAAYAWRHRQVQAATSLAAFMVGVTVWTAAAGVGLLLDGQTALIVAHGVRLGASGVVVASFLGLAMELAGYGDLLDRRAAVLLGVEPLVMAVLTATTGLQGLAYASIEPSPDPLTAVVPEPAIGFWLHLAYSYLLVGVAMALLVGQLLRSRGIYRRQIATVIVGAVLALGSNLALTLGLTTAEVEPIGFAAMGLLTAWAIRHYRLIDLAPIARRQIVATLPDPVVVIDDRDRITDCNEAALALLDATEAAVLGSDFRAAFDAVATDVAAFEDAIQHSDVVAVPVGEEVRRYEARLSPIVDDRGEDRGRILLLHDVTEREQHRRRLERTNEQLDRFASVVSHDLRNPLSVADGYLELARTDGDEEHFETVADAHARMQAIIDDVLALARGGPAVEDSEPVAIADVAERAWEHVETGEASLVVETDLVVEADADRLERLFENLYRNAIDHAQEGRDADSGPLTVTVGRIEGASRREDHDARAEVLRDDLKAEAPGDPVDRDGFYVADDGIGIPEADRERVFEPGETSGGDGTGLGLAIVRSIAQAHGWSVRATDAEDGGARFDVTGAAPAPEGAPADSAGHSAEP